MQLLFRRVAGAGLRIFCCGPCRGPWWCLFEWRDRLSDRKVVTEQSCVWQNVSFTVAGLPPPNGIASLLHSSSACQNQRAETNRTSATVCVAVAQCHLHLPTVIAKRAASPTQRRWRVADAYRLRADSRWTPYRLDGGMALGVLECPVQLDEG